MRSFYFRSHGIPLNFPLFHFFSNRSFSSHLDPFSFWLLSPLQLQPLFLPFQLFRFYPKYQGYFSLTLSISSPSYLGILTARRLRVLFKLSYAPLMQQKLGKNPLINVEVNIFLLLAPSRSFPRLIVSSRSHILVIRASRLK